MATSRTRTTDSDTCPRCFSRLKSDPTEEWCPECGLVTEENPIDHSADWRSFPGDETDPERAKPGNRNHPDRGLGSHRETHTAKPWLNAAEKSDPSSAGMRGYGTTEIHRMGVALGLPVPIFERAKYLFRQTHADGGVTGRDADAVAAGCLLTACREGQQGRVVDEIADVARCESKPIRRRMRDVASECGVLLPPPDAGQRCRVVAAKLAVDRETVEDAVKQVRAVEGGGSPSTLVGAVLYDSTDHTQAEVAEAACVTTVGIRKRRKQLG